MSHTPLWPAPPAGYRVRRPRPDDVAAVAALKRACDIDRHGESDATEHEVAEEWALPRLRTDDDVWLVESSAGEIVGYGFVYQEDPPAMFVSGPIVHPDHRGRGIDEFLLERSEERAAQVAATAEPPGAATLSVWAHEKDGERIALYAARRYRHVRTFVRLQVSLAEPSAAPVWPPGIAVRGFRRDHDEAAVHAAVTEAFQDHWRPDVMDFREWLAFRFKRPGLDLGLWWVAWDGGEVAGMLLAFTTPLGAYVDEARRAPSVARPRTGPRTAAALLRRVPPARPAGRLPRRGQREPYRGLAAVRFGGHGASPRLAPRVRAGTARPLSRPGHVGDMPPPGCASVKRRRGSSQARPGMSPAILLRGTMGGPGVNGSAGSEGRMNVQLIALAVFVSAPAVPDLLAYSTGMLASGLAPNGGPLRASAAFRVTSLGWPGRALGLAATAHGLVWEHHSSDDAASGNGNVWANDFDRRRACAVCDDGAPQTDGVVVGPTVFGADTRSGDRERYARSLQP